MITTPLPRLGEPAILSRTVPPRRESGGWLARGVGCAFGGNDGRGCTRAAAGAGVAEATGAVAGGAAVGAAGAATGGTTGGTAGVGVPELLSWINASELDAAIATGALSSSCDLT